MTDIALPAVCGRCGALWVPRAIVLGPGVADVTIENVTVAPCPRCGGEGTIPDGIYGATEAGAITVRRLTPEQRRRIAAELERGRAAGVAPAEVADAIEALAASTTENADAIRALADQVRRTPGADWKWLLAILLAALQVVGSFKGEVADLARRVFDRVTEAAPAEPPRKVGRNDPCWCGSGDKFKFCHGANRDGEE